MTYRYTLDSYGEQHSYRLCDNNLWRKRLAGVKGSINIKDCDKVITDFRELDKYLARDQKVVLGGKSYLANITDKENFDPRKHTVVFPRLHRTHVPRKFTQAELKEVIAAGDDSKVTCLTLSIDGYFALIEDDRQINLNTTAVRDEDSIPGERTIGEEAVNDYLHMDSLFRRMLSAWREHLQSRELDYVVEEETPDESEDEMWHDIDKLFSKLIKRQQTRR